MLQYQQAVRSKTPAGGRNRLVGWLVVRRIEQYEIKPHAVEIGERPDKAAADDNIAAGDAAVREVGRDQVLSAAITLDERHLGGAPADGFDAQRPGPRVAVEHARTADARRDDVEQRFSQFVGGRPQLLPGWRLQSTALERTCDHPHLGKFGIRNLEFGMREEFGMRTRMPNMECGREFQIPNSEF